ncbi:4-aminobutyrate aminotransferase [Thermoflexales bacterium]|nr:4-aminobutyrate aminotransferase [Thermoflexales bacterium]
MPGIDHIGTVWGRAFNVMVDRGEGVYLIDTAGRRYLDFTCGIGVTSTGHAHPKVAHAIADQATQLIHGQANLVYHRPMMDLIDELSSIMAWPALSEYFFSNSGAEIVEAAVKLAKHATQRQNVIVFNGSFHGRTHLTMAMTTSKTIYKIGYQPLVAGIFVTPYPYAYQLKMTEAETTDYCLRELKRLLKSQTAPEETACIVVEPVLGEGGYVVPPVEFMRELRVLCDQSGVLLVADEVQSGVGRTGKWFASEHFDVEPDVLITAKGLASGMPLSALVTRQDLMLKWIAGSHGGTYGGNAVACAAAVATLRVIKEEYLLDNVNARSEQLLAGLRRLQQDFSVIGDVRGKGLMVATEFTRNGEPDTTTSKAVVKAAFDRGLMLLTCGTYDNVIRWIPPLVVNEQELDEALKIFAAALDAVAG